MNSENDLMQKLVVAKKIMDAHNKTPRAGNSGGIPSTPMLEQFNAPPAMYNIPQEYMAEQKQVQPQQTSQLPVKDRILNSRLPDEIKKLMIEHPIDQPNTMVGPTLSNDLIESVSRLMKTDAAGGTSPQNQQHIQQPQTQNQPQNMSGIDYSLLKSIIRDTITEVLTEKGMIVESVSKTKEQISFRVGQHVFEGVVTKIKKMK
jgi:hypothetical protein